MFIQNKRRLAMVSIVLLVPLLSVSLIWRITRVSAQGLLSVEYTGNRLFRDDNYTLIATDVDVPGQPRKYRFALLDNNGEGITPQPTGTPSPWGMDYDTYDIFGKHPAGIHIEMTSNGEMERQIFMPIQTGPTPTIVYWHTMAENNCEEEQLIGYDFDSWNIERYLKTCNTGSRSSGIYLQFCDFDQCTDVTPPAPNSEDWWYFQPMYGLANSNLYNYVQGVTRDNSRHFIRIDDAGGIETASATIITPPGDWSADFYPKVGKVNDVTLMQLSDTSFLPHLFYSTDGINFTEFSSRFTWNTLTYLPHTTCPSFILSTDGNDAHVLTTCGGFPNDITPAGSWKVGTLTHPEHNGDLLFSLQDMTTNEWKLFASTNGAAPVSHDLPGAETLLTTIGSTYLYSVYQTDLERHLYSTSDYNSFTEHNVGDWQAIVYIGEFSGQHLFQFIDKTTGNAHLFTAPDGTTLTERNVDTWDTLSQVYTESPFEAQLGIDGNLYLMFGNRLHISSDGINYTDITPASATISDSSVDYYLGDFTGTNYFLVNGRLLAHDGSTALAVDETPTAPHDGWDRGGFVVVDADQAYLTLKDEPSSFATGDWQLFEAPSGARATWINITPADSAAPWQSIRFLGASGENRNFEFVSVADFSYHIYTGDGRVVPTAVQLNESGVQPTLLPVWLLLVALISVSLSFIWRLWRVAIQRQV